MDFEETRLHNLVGLIIFGFVLSNICFIFANLVFFFFPLVSTNLVFHLLFSFCNLIFHLLFSFCNLVFAFCFYNFLFWSNHITSRRYLFSFCDIYLVFSIWFFILRCFCILVLCNCWLWLLKEIIHFSLWVWGWMGSTIHIGVM